MVQSYYLRLVSIISIIAWSRSPITFLTKVAADLHKNDVIQTSRRQEYELMKQRTKWFDVLEKDCPKFMRKRYAQVVLERPLGFVSQSRRSVYGDKKYKIQFSFDNERHHTQWIDIDINTNTNTDGNNNNNYNSVQVIKFLFTHSVGHIMKVQTETYSMKEKVVGNNQRSQNQRSSNNKTSSAGSNNYEQQQEQWPKRVLLKYEFEETSAVDVNLGIAVMLAFCLFAFVFSVSNIKLESNSDNSNIDDDDDDGEKDRYKMNRFADEANVVNNDLIIVNRRAKRAADFI